MIQNDEPFFPNQNLMQKLRHDEDQLQNEKKEYQKYQTYLNNEIKDLFIKNEQLLSCFISHKKIFEDLELRNNQLDERYQYYLLEESRSKKIRARLIQIKNTQNPIYPSRVLIPMENNTENQYNQLSKEYQDLENKISQINIDNVSRLLEKKQKLEEKHIKLKKELAELMSLLDKSENKLSKKTESLFSHMLNAMDECDKNRKKLFIFKHGSQSQIDELNLYTEDTKDETNDVIDLLKLFPDIQPSPNLQELINEEMELKKRREAKRKRIEAMKKKDEEFLRNLNHRQRPNYYQIRPPSQKKGSNPNASISDSGEKNRNDQISRLRLTLNNHYAAMKNSNKNNIQITSPTADNSLLPEHKKNGRRKINSKQILIGDPQRYNDQLNGKLQIEQDDNKFRKMIRKKRKKHTNQNSLFPKKHTIHIHSSEFASSSSTSAARKREENLLLSLNQNIEENANYDLEDDTKHDQENGHPKNHKINIRKSFKNHETKIYHDEFNDGSDEEIEDKQILKDGKESNNLTNKNNGNLQKDEADYKLTIKEDESNSESESTNGNTFEFEQTLEQKARWQFHIENPNSEPNPPILHIDHNPKQFVEEESNKEDYSKTEFIQEIIEEEEVHSDKEEQVTEKIIIQKKKSKRRRKHKHHNEEVNVPNNEPNNKLNDEPNNKLNDELNPKLNIEINPELNDELNIELNNELINALKQKTNNDKELIKSHRGKSPRKTIIKTFYDDDGEFNFTIKTRPSSSRRSNSVQNTNQEIPIIHKRKRKYKHRSKSIEQKENQDEDESNSTQKVEFQLQNSKKSDESKLETEDSNDNENDDSKKPLKKIPMKKKRLLNPEIAKKPVIIEEQKSTIENLGGRPHGSHSNHHSHHHHHHHQQGSDKSSKKSNDSNKSKQTENKIKIKNDDDNDDNGYPSDKNYEYNYEYDYEFDDKDYYSNDNKRSKRRRHGHHYRRKTNRRFYTHHPRHRNIRSNHHYSRSQNRYSTQRPTIRSYSRSRKSSYEEEEEEERVTKKQQQRRRNVRSNKQEPRRIRRHHDYYSNSSDYYSDSYHYSDDDYDYNDPNNGYNTVSDDYEYEIQEESVFTPLSLQISKDVFIHEEKEKPRNPRVFQRKIIPKQTQEGSEKSSLSMSLKTGNDPSNPDHQKQIKESKTFTQLNTLNDFVIHEPNETFESLRRRGKGEQLDLEIAQTRNKLSKIVNDINDLQKKLKLSLRKESSTQVDEPFSMKSLQEMKNEIKSHENYDDLLNQAQKQKELLEQEIPDKQNRLSELQKQYVRKAATLRHYKQMKEELDEQHFFLINLSKKQIKKLNDLDEQIRRGRRTIELIDGRIADIRNIIDIKTKELSAKANKKRPNVVGMCDKFKKDRLSEKEILQLIDYHDIERQYLEKEIESISYQLSDDSLTKKELEIKRVVIIAKQLKAKYFEKRGMANQTMITITNEDDLNMISKRKSLTKEEIHSTMMQIDLVISQIQKQISQLSNKNIEVPPPPSSFLNLQALKKSKLESMTSLS